MGSLREKKEKEQEEKKHATGGERANRTVAAASVPLFFLCAYMSVRCRSFYSYSNCIYSENEKERERGREKKNDEQEYTYTYYSKAHWTTTTYGRDACVQRTSSCQKIAVVIVIG
jgi:hypothetical protein